LAAAYARESGAAVAWLTLHADDRDSRVLFSHLRDVIEAEFEDSDALPNLRRGLVESAEGSGLARLLLRDLADAPEGFILVLDDFHVVEGATDVQQAVDALVRGLPEVGQVVVTAREPPSLSMARLVASDTVFALGPEDLRFTDEEVASLRRLLGGDASHDEEAEGWVAGILLGGAPRQLGVVGGALLGAYVEREVLQRLRPSEQRWLEAFAVAETVDVASAARLAGAGPWSARLASLAERCPFLVAGNDGRYRLHALVREALLNRLRRGNLKRAMRVWAVARQLAEESLDTVGMVRACQELGQIDDAVALVGRAVEENLHAGRWGATLATVELLPVSVRRGQPRLSLAEAHALVQSGHPQPARDAADMALQSGGRTGDEAVQIEAVLELANVARYLGELDVAEDWLSAADSLLRRASLPTTRHRELEGRAMALRGVSLAVRGDTEAARRQLEASVERFPEGSISRDYAGALANLGTLCARTGDYEAARRVLAQSVSQWRRIGDRATLAQVQTLLGNLFLRSGDLDAAGSALSEALEAARAAGVSRGEGHALNSLADWHRASGRVGDAAEHYDRALRLAEDVGERELLVESLRLRAEVAIVQNDLAKARSLLTRAQAEGQRLGSSFQLAGVERALGRLHLAEGAVQRAAGHLEAALERSAGVWGPFERLGAQYWLGTAYLLAGEVRRVEATLGEVINLAEQAGGADALASVAAEDPRLLRHGLQHGTATDLLTTAQHIAERRQPWAGVTDVVPVEIVARNDLPRIEVHLFDGLRLFRDGKLQDAGRRGADRARELLTILALHPRGLPDREIGTMLWPEMPEQRALHNLQMTTYLLRRMLGGKPAVRYTNGTYQLWLQLDLWVDAREFDTELERARLAPADAAAQALRRAVDLYQGPLLPGIARDWADTARATYQLRFVNAALRLADLLTRDHPDESNALAERVLDVALENEAAYRRLLENAHAAGDVASVARIARRYRTAMLRLGLTPNPSLLRDAQ
jgi:ATP/maltotriose-dependent transcriptional regulator MalT/DNA-binding SARP family transcriptional activator